jgi:molecular chaperone DnaK (HSP70)
MPADASAPAIGIDLGTTNSLAAVLTARGPVVLRDQDGEALIPSVVAFPPDGGAPIVGRAARAKSFDWPERTVFSVKRLIGRSGAELLREAEGLPFPLEIGERGLPRIRIGERRLAPEEISALVLQEVRRTASAALGVDVTRAVITVPAYFDDAQRQATRQAAELAGLDCLRILNEPTAASLAYGIDGSKDGTVLVYDLGGGTFDVSVLRIQQGVFRVLATAGDTHLGGDDFDRLLVQRILAVLREQTGRDEAPSPYVLQAVRRSAEGLKIRLSSEPTAALAIDLGAAGKAALTVTRDELEAVLAPWIDRTIDAMRRSVHDAGLRFDQIDDVVLVGGSTRIPLVRRRVAEVAGRAPHVRLDPDLTVALGAAIQAGVLEGKTRSLLLLDVIPLSLGIETLGGLVDKLILRNATIPASATAEFSTHLDGQTAVDINIYQGERELAADCRKLGAFKLRGIPPMPAGLPRIAVTFLVDADGVLRVGAREQRTGVEASIQVVPTFGLTGDEVRRIMHDAIDHARDDAERRERIELRMRARALVRGTRRALELAQLPPDETWTIRRCAQRIDDLLAREADAGADASADTPLRDAVDELSRLTAQIADDVIGAAVKQALQAEQQGREGA